MATEFTIINRTINTPVDLDIIVQGETNSKIIKFSMQNRYFDGVDLTEKTIKVAYQNAKGETGSDNIVLDVVEENTFSFNWAIQSNLTIKSGTVSIWIEISSVDYLWKTKPKTFTIEPSINVIGNASSTNYALQQAFFATAVNNANIINADTSEPIYISGRDILMTPLNEFVVCGDNRSQILSFSMDRYYQNIDRSTKKIAIAFVNANNRSDRAGIVNRIVTDTTITFGWLIDSKVTEKAGTVNFYIEVLGYDENNKFTCWKTLGAQFNVESGLSVNENIEEPSPSWIQIFETDKDNFFSSENIRMTESINNLMNVKSTDIDTITNNKMSEIDVRFQNKYDTIATEHAISLTDIRTALEGKAPKTDIDTINTNINVLSNKVDNIVLNPSGNTSGTGGGNIEEIVDGRTDSVGFKNKTVGENIRSIQNNLLKVVGGIYNLYNGQHTAIGTTLNSTTGALENKTTTGIVSDWIAVKPLTTYSHTVSATTIGWSMPFYYNASKTLISSLDSAFQPKFTTPANCYYIRLVGNSFRIDGFDIQLNEGNTVLPFDGYKPYLRQNYIEEQLNTILKGTNPIYYLSQYGNDSNTGLSEQFPKKTLRSVNNLSNCTILLKSGEEFTLDSPDMLYFQVGSNCNVSHYGGTAKPIINGYITLNLTWTKYSANIYKASLINQGLYNVLGGFDLCNVGHMIVDGKYNGKRVQTLATLVKEDEYFVDETTTDIYYYSTSNVATMQFKSAINAHGICFNGASNSSISGLEMTGFGRHGIWIKESSNIKINNNYIHHIGGCKQSTTIAARYGNGIEIWDNCNNILCEHNHVTDIFDAGVTNQTASAKTQYNITYRKNIIERCWYCIEVFDGSSTARANFKNILYEDNILIDCCEWGRSATNGYRFNSGQISGACFRLSCTSPNQLTLKNNVCYLSYCYMIYAGTENGITYDGNMYIQKTGGNTFYPSSHIKPANESLYVVAISPSTTDEFAIKSYALSLINAKKATF